jgi:hypothetical protein
MWNQLVSLFSQPKTKPRAARITRDQRRTRLTLECLEGRWMPAGLTLDWNGAVGAAWSQAGNWIDEATGIPPAKAPQAADTAVFKGTTTNGDGQVVSEDTDCTIDCANLTGPMGMATGPTVTNFLVQAGYSSNITIGNVVPGTTAGTVTVSGTLNFGGVGATIFGDKGAGGTVGQAPVQIAGGLIWSVGTLNNLSVNTQSGSVNTISGTGVKSVTSSLLSTNGTTTWTDGDIATAGTTPQIANAGAFKMQSSGTLGTAGVGTFTNGGGLATGVLTELGGTGTTTVAIPFTNNGTFVIQSGIVAFTSTSVQGALNGMQQPPPLTQMNGGSLTDGTYTVFEGVFEGTGTVTGNLTDNGGAVKLGLGGAPGGLTVTKTYTQTSGSLNVYINATGTCSTLTAKDVALGGSLWVHNTPYAGTNGFTFLTSTNAMTGDFAGGGMGATYDKPTWGNPPRHFLASMAANQKSYSLANLLS